MYQHTAGGKSYVVALDGAIYNYNELKKELINKGHAFTNGTASELICKGYEEYGIEILQKIRGAYSFALWDIKQETMLLARDIFGIKPLYYTNMLT